LAHRPIITLTTDFGLSDHFVGTVKGVILSILPDAELVDISHSVEAFDVLDGALTIASSYSYFPAGTVHLVVVDPGVGTVRRPIVSTTEQHHFVAPDNGVLSYIYNREERIRVHHVTAEHYFLQPISQTFHARDIFARIAAYLAKGVAPATFGEEVKDFVRLDVPRPTVVNENTWRGAIIKVDRFGNLIANFTPDIVPSLFQSEPPPFKIRVGGREITALQNAYGNTPPGTLFGILGSMGYLEIAANQASASKILDVGKGARVEVVLEAMPSVGTS
jgi:S-adenosyl-L-methionine hydrolase (adenosine-forming)